MQNIEKIKALYPLIIGEHTQILRTKCKEVKKITPEVQEFGENLLDLMRAYDGVGLAAPQVNQDLQMCAVTFRKNGKHGEENIGEEVLINPKVIDRSEKEITSEEACLSLPNMQGNVTRKERIVIEYMNLKGKKKRKKLKGFNAIIVQHEIDHLHGILFIDKLIKK